jgi:hypothetical protein
MTRLNPEHYKALARLKRLPEGQTLVGLLTAALEEAQLNLRTATGERIGWSQGEAQCLAGWLRSFEQADELGR